MKKAILAMLCLSICLLAACGRQESEIPETPAVPAASEPSGSEPSGPEPAPKEEFPSIRIEGETYLPLAAALADTAVTFQWDEGRLRLEETGIEAYLCPDEPYLYRRDYIVGVLPGPLVVRDEEGYLPEALREQWLKEGRLLDHLLFFPDEVAAALEAPEEAQSKAILSEVEQPRSMDIDIPNLDAGRIFREKPLGDYPAILAEELEGMGFENAAEYAYSEYVVLTEARSVEQAGLSQWFLREKALEGEDPAQWTVREYKNWQTECRMAEAEAGLTETQRAFLEEKHIQLDDLHWLEKDFFDSYVERSDEELRQVIEAYYQMVMGLLK